MARKTSAAITAEIEVLRAEFLELDTDDAGEDEVARAEEIPDEIKELEVERKQALKREADREMVRSLAAAGKTEDGDGARYLGGTGPEVKKTIDPFADDARMLPKQEVISRAMSFIDQEKRVYVSDDNKAHLERLIHRSEDQIEGLAGGEFDGSYIARRTLLTENPLYRSAFMKYVRFGDGAALTSGEHMARSAYQEFEISRAAGEVTTTAGGFGVPVIIDSSIIMTSGAADVPILKYSRIEQVTNNIWKGVSSTAMAWSFDTEAAEVSDDMTTLAQPTVTVHMARGFIPYSIEVGQDYPNFAQEFGRLINAGYDDLLAVMTMTGSGTGQPWGIFPAIDATAASEVIPTTDGLFGGVDVFKAWNALPERFRSKATWVMSVSVESAIRQFAAAAGSSSSYFTIDLTQGGVTRINGRPVVVTDYAPSFSGSVPGTTGPQNILIVGDFNHYLVAQRAGMSVETIPHLFHTTTNLPSYQRGLAAWARIGADSIVDRAFILLQNQ